jgi:predicted HTH transcriptional regulator
MRTAQAGTPSPSLFSDRVEMGTWAPPFGLTLGDIQEGSSKLRNRVIGRVFKELGLIEQWGSGIQRMIGACREAGLADPVFEERAAGFRVTIHAASARAPLLDPMDSAVLQILRARDKAGGAATSEVAHAIGRSDRSTRTRLVRLADRGLVVRLGSSRNDPKAR